jgi:hypothetical protein
MGLILNVLDRDRNGWGEVLFTQEGYESRSISLLEYSPAGLQSTGISMGGGGVSGISCVELVDVLSSSSS